MAERTGTEKLIADGHRYVSAGLAAYTIVRVARKRDPRVADLLQVAAAVLFFTKSREPARTATPAD